MGITAKILKATGEASIVMNFFWNGILKEDLISNKQEKIDLVILTKGKVDSIFKSTQSRQKLFEHIVKIL